MSCSPAWFRAVLVCAVLSSIAPAFDAPPSSESLSFRAEWRFVRAGEIAFHAAENKSADLNIRSVGLVATLLKVDNTYRALFDPGFCTSTLNIRTQEGRRNRETKVAFDRTSRKSSYVERDLTRDAMVLAKEMEIPACTHDVIGGLQRLREMRPAPGAVLELPISDGKKVVAARVEAQAKETITTPAGVFPAIRYEVFLFNGVLYSRKGRLFVWLSEDDKRYPVQVRVQLPFYIGTVTVQLEKAERK
jgi:hypothetical protein